MRELTLLTWNVWFGLARPHRRWTELLAKVGELQPDVIAFQEVTDPFLEMLREAEWCRAGYHLSDETGASLERYGTVVGTRLEPERIDVHPLESEMARRLIVVEATVGDARWAFAGVHLESLRPSAEVRRRQLGHVFELLAPHENAVLMGDLNFCSSWTEENDRIPEAWVDLWPAVRTDEGFTVDSHLNRMRLREVPGWKRVRYDRILLRSDSARPVSAELVGKESIEGTKPALFPSDHFGVWGRVEVRSP